MLYAILFSVLLRPILVFILGIILSIYVGSIQNWFLGVLIFILTIPITLYLLFKEISRQFVNFAEILRDPKKFITDPNHITGRFPWYVRLFYGKKLNQKIEDLYGSNSKKTKKKYVKSKLK